METVLKKKAAAVLAAAIVAFAAMLAGCSGAPEAPSSSSETASSSSEAAAASAIVIGDSAAGAAVSLENATGGTVTLVGIAPAGADEQPATLAIEGGAWEDGQAALLYYTQDEEASAYDLEINVDDTLYDLHGIELDQIESAKLALDGTFAYLTYEADDATVSTLEAEKALAAQVQAAAEAEAAAAAAEEAAAAEAEAAAAAAAEAEAAAAEPEVYYEEPVATYEPAPAVESAPAQSADGCVEGGVVLR